MRRAAALVACVALVACEAPSPPRPTPPALTGPLPSGAAARVGDALVNSDQVARIAAAQSVAPAAARDLAIRDAVFAAEARARGIDNEPSLRLAESALLARLLVKDIAATAEAEGPVTDAELDAVTRRHWVELDRPESSRTAHAVVTLKKDAPAAVRTAAAALAESIRAAAAKVAPDAAKSQPQREPRGPEDLAVTAFRKAVNEVPKGDQEVRIEALPPVVADGRVVSEGGGNFDPTFARAAADLKQRGDLSAVVETPFGYHVILLLERVPAQSVPREERRAMVREEVMSTRARAAKEKLLRALAERVKISGDADAVLALMPVEK